MLSRRTTDADQRQAFVRARGIELRYARELRDVARQIGRIVAGFPLGTEESDDQIFKALTRYADILGPWARSIAGRVIKQLDDIDRKSWQRYTKGFSKELRRELEQEVNGEKLREFLDSQVHYIKSLPLEAAQRVHQLTYEGLMDSKRAPEIQKKILETGHVTAARAMLIARTETGRTQTGLIEARATHVGSEGYIWRTSRDADVRDSHRKMEGVFVRWDSPPTLDRLTGHAGCLPNCRCYPEPVLPKNLQF